MLVQHPGPSPALSEYKINKPHLRFSRVPVPRALLGLLARGFIPLMSFLITSSVPLETSDLFKNREINNIVPEVPPPAFRPPNEVLAGLVGALFPGFSTLCRLWHAAPSAGTIRSAALKGFPKAWWEEVGGQG